MEKAVPRQNSLKGLLQGQRAHIADDPRVSGQAVATQRNERRGRIDAGNFQTLRCQVARDRVARSAAEVEHARTLWEHGDETIMPRLVVPRGAGAILIPGCRVTLVVPDDAVGEVTHNERLAMRRKALKRKPRPLAGVFVVLHLEIIRHVHCRDAVRIECSDPDRGRHSRRTRHRRCRDRSAIRPARDAYCARDGR